MHPWKKIIRGKIEELEKKACFICLERIQDSDDDKDLKLHLFKVHSVQVHLKKLVEMCSEAEEIEEREGWSLDDILEEERNRIETEAKKRAESGGIFQRKKRTPECLDNNAGAKKNEVDCFLCQEQLNSCEYDKHLEKKHGVIFGVKDIKKAGESNKEPNHENEEAEPELSWTDSDTVKELVKMKYLPKKRMRLRTQRERLFSKKYQVLIEEVFVNHNIASLIIILQDTGHAAEKV